MLVKKEITRGHLQWSWMTAVIDSTPRRYGKRTLVGCSGGRSKRVVQTALNTGPYPSQHPQFKAMLQHQVHLLSQGRVLPPCTSRHLAGPHWLSHQPELLSSACSLPVPGSAFARRKASPGRRQRCCRRGYRAISISAALAL